MQTRNTPQTNAVLNIINLLHTAPNITNYMFVHKLLVLVLLLSWFCDIKNTHSLLLPAPEDRDREITARPMVTAQPLELENLKGEGRGVLLYFNNTDIGGI